MYQQIRRYLPICNFAVAVTGVAFQMIVLYPWHKQISNEIAEMQTGTPKKNQGIIAVSNEITWEISDGP